MSESIGSIDTIYRKSKDSEITVIEYNPDYRFSVNENNSNDSNDSNDMNIRLLRDTTKNECPLCLYVCIVVIIILFIFILVVIILNALKII